MKKASIITGIAAMVLIGCGTDNGIGAGDTICGMTTKKLIAEELKYYPQHEERFWAETGCLTVQNCKQYILIKEETCIEDVR